MLMRDEEAPRIVTPLPGPRAQELIAADELYTSPSYTRVYPLAVESGAGAVIEDVDGNRFLDFTAGIAVCSTGHCHPRIVSAIQAQTSRLLHMSGTDFYYSLQGELAAKLAQLAPSDAKRRVFFTNSGTESVEAAFKLARFHTGRPRMVAFSGAFHGRTFGSMSLTGSKSVQRRGFAPLVPGVTHVPYPAAARRTESVARDTEGQETLDQLERAFRTTTPPEEVAAIIAEPIQGEGGYLVPPPNFHLRLQEIARRHGILVIADEVQSGMGRTGRMFASEHFGVEPDILCVAKGIASGMPLGAMIAREDIMTWPPGSHASTFGGNPVCCAAALETIALLEEDLLNNASRAGDYLQSRLAECIDQHESIADVRGRGLMIGVELTKDRASYEPAPELCERVIQDCFQHGLLLLSCGKSTVRFCPPLVITKSQTDSAVEIFAEALERSK